MELRYLRTLLGLSLVLGAVCGLVAFATACWPDPFDTRPFDPAVWAAGDNHDRGAMARGAIRRLPPGVFEAEVVALLGAGIPIEEAWPSAYGKYGAVKGHSYHVGCWSGHFHRDAHDSTFLWVHIGADGRVVAAEIGGG